MILLDTNTLIHYLKGRESVVSRLQRSSRRELAIPSVVAYELEYGSMTINSARRRTAVSDLIAGIDQVPFDWHAAQEAAQIRLDLERRSLLIGPIDLLVAGTAVSRGAVLVTNNTAEFSRVRGLRLTDWSR